MDCEVVPDDHHGNQHLMQLVNGQGVSKSCSQDHGSLIVKHKLFNSQLQKGLYQQWIDRENCDMVLTTLGPDLPVHSCVTACFSATLNSFLSDSAKYLPPDTGQKTFCIDFSFQTVESLVIFMYTGSLALTCQGADEMLRAAKWLQITAAVSILQEFTQCECSCRFATDSSAHINGFTASQVPSSATSPESVMTSQVSASASLPESVTTSQVSASASLLESVMTSQVSASASLPESVTTSQVSASASFPENLELVPTEKDLTSDSDLVETDRFIKTEPVDISDTEMCTPLKLDVEEDDEYTPASYQHLEAVDSEADVLSVDISSSTTPATPFHTATTSESTMPPTKCVEMDVHPIPPSASLQAVVLVHKLPYLTLERTEIISGGRTVCKDNISKTQTKKGNKTTPEATVIDETPSKETDGSKPTSKVRDGKKNTLKVRDGKKSRLKIRDGCSERIQNNKIKHQAKKKQTGIQGKKRPHTCFSCGEVFVSRNQLRFHKREKHAHHACSFCSMNCATAGTLLSHVRQLHQLWKCQHCNKKFKAHQLVSHSLLAHNEKKPFACPVTGCPFKSTSMRLLSRHHNSVHLCEPDVVCDHCGKSFQNKARLRSHVRHCVDDGVLGENPETDKKCVKTESSISTTSSSAAAAADVHVKTESGMMLPCENSQVDKSEDNSGTAVDERNPVDNVDMDVKEVKEVTSSSQPEQPENIDDTARKNHVCQVCEESFELEKDLVQHKAELHSIFFCSFCQKHFSCKSNLARHMRKLHHVWKCHYCELQFNRSRKLRFHCSKVHHEEKAFICPSPGCRFKTHMVKHFSVHEKNSHRCGPRMFCEKCGKNFRKALMLQYHRKFCTGENKVQYICKKTVQERGGCKILVRPISPPQPDDPVTGAIETVDVPKPVQETFDVSLPVQDKVDESIPVQEKVDVPAPAQKNVDIVTPDRELEVGKPEEKAETASTNRDLNSFLEEASEVKAEAEEEDIASKESTSAAASGGRQHCCKICSGVFETERELKMHKTVEHSQHACSDCSRTFLAKGSLTLHIGKMHRQWQCRHCDQTFKSPCDFKNHCMEAHGDEKPFVCLEPGCSFKAQHPGRLNEHEKNVHSLQDGIVCDDCGKRFRSRGSIYAHKKKCGKPKPARKNGKTYKCDMCEQVLQSIKELRHHKVCEHASFCCNFCSKSFVTRALALSHMSRVHYTWKCRHCGEIFKHHKDLKQHGLDAHNEEKPFECFESNCTYTCKKLRQLTQHIKLIHILGPVVCENCGKSFASGNSIRVHQKCCVNKGQHLCQECGRVFDLIQSLNQHILVVHRKVSRYTCKVCNRKFNDHRNLLRHMRIHNNEFPYPCDLCDLKFRHSNSLKYHKQRKH